MCVILEPASQEQRGINSGCEEFMKGTVNLCDEEGILMICDEVRVVREEPVPMFTWQSAMVSDLILCLGEKAIGNGIPVGAFGNDRRDRERLTESGDHGTTHGGTPLWLVQL